MSTVKSLSDQLANVGNKVSDTKLVLRLCAGLTREYNIVVTVIQQSDSLPTFNKARSMLCLEETSHSQQSPNSSTGFVLVAPSLLTAQQSSSMPSHTYIPNHVSYSFNAPNYSRGGGSNRGKKNNWRGERVGRNIGRGAGRFNFQQDYGSRPYGQPQHQPWVSPWGAQQQSWGNWASPPAPYLSAPYQQQQRQPTSILGAGPRLQKQA